MISSTKKLSRQKDHREQLLKNLLTSLVLNGRVVTTEAKAKALRPLAERFLTLAKSDSLASRRQAASLLTTKAAAAKLTGEILPRVPAAGSGLVKLVRTTPRRGDNAPQIAVILRQEIPAPETAKKSPAKSKKPETPVTKESNS